MAVLLCVAFTASIRLSYILVSYRHVRNQGRRQPAAAKLPCLAAVQYYQVGTSRHLVSITKGVILIVPYNAQHARLPHSPTSFPAKFPHSGDGVQAPGDARKEIYGRDISKAGIFAACAVLGSEKVGSLGNPSQGLCCLKWYTSGGQIRQL